MPFVAGRPLEPEASMSTSPERCWCRNSPRNGGLFSMTDASNALMMGCSAKDEDGNMGFRHDFCAHAVDCVPASADAISVSIPNKVPDTQTEKVCNLDPF